MYSVCVVLCGKYWKYDDDIGVLDYDIDVMYGDDINV